jgi:hypothetical protein
VYLHELLLIRWWKVDAGLLSGADQHSGMSMIMFPVLAATTALARFMPRPMLTVSSNSAAHTGVAKSAGRAECACLRRPARESPRQVTVLARRTFNVAPDQGRMEGEGSSFCLAEEQDPGVFLVSLTSGTLEYPGQLLSPDHT